MKTSYESNLNTVEQALKFFEDYASEILDLEEKELFKIYGKVLTINNNFRRTINLSSGDALDKELIFVKSAIDAIKNEKRNSWAAKSARSSAWAAGLSALFAFFTLLISILQTYKDQGDFFLWCAKIFR